MPRPRPCGSNRVALPFGPGASHGVVQAVGGGGPLDAETPVGMRGVCSYPRQAPVLNRCQDTTTGPTHRTVGMPVLDGHGATLLPLVRPRMVRHMWIAMERTPAKSQLYELPSPRVKHCHVLQVPHEAV